MSPVENPGSRTDRRSAEGAPVQALPEGDFRVRNKLSSESATSPSRLRPDRKRRDPRLPLARVRPILFVL